MTIVGIVLWAAVIITTTQSRSASPAPTPFNIVEATIDDVQAALRSRQITCRSLVERYLERIETYDKAGPALNAVQTVNAHALQDAERLDVAFNATGPVGPLHCVHSHGLLWSGRPSGPEAQRGSRRCSIR